MDPVTNRPTLRQSVKQEIDRRPNPAGAVAAEAPDTGATP